MQSHSLRQWASCLALTATALTAQASPVLSTHAGSAATAQTIAGSSFTLEYQVDVRDSTVIAHAEISSSGTRPVAGKDFYQFTTLGGTTHMDIDHTNSFNSELGIWDSLGRLIASVDDSGRDPGSEDNGADAGWWGLNLAAGTYVIGVCRRNCGFEDGFVMTGPDIQSGNDYVLNISTNVAEATQTVPEPATASLALLALAGAAASRRAARRRPA